MKKKVIILVICALVGVFTSVLFSQSSNDLGSFMGARWGVSALDFKNAFIYTDLLKWKEYFYLEKFKLEDIFFERIDFYFFDKDGLKPSKLNKGVAHMFFLNKVEIRLRDCFYDYLLRIFKFKYGTPKNVEKNINNQEIKTIWISADQQRMVILTRYSEESGMSKAVLVPFNQDFLLSEAVRIQKIAAQI